MKFREVSEKWAAEYCRDFKPISAIGHSDTAKMLGIILEVPIKAARISLEVKAGDYLLIAQYTGPRLPEKCVLLPANAAFTWWWVSVEHPD